MSSIAILPLPGMPEIAPGDDLAQALDVALRRADLALRRDDILVVTQKIISKAEDRFVSLDSVCVDERALALARNLEKDPRLVALILAESIEIVRAERNVLITRHRLGYVMANAGIDASNIGVGGGERVLLLPKDPDSSAMRLAQALARLTGVEPGVVISDSFGRPWRNGVVNVAIGAYGVESLIDRRGEKDRDGRELRVTQVALADLLASAAGLVLGEGAEGVPAVLVRGYPRHGAGRGASALVRPVEEDLFR